MMATEACKSAEYLAKTQGQTFTRFQFGGINCWGHYTPAGLSIYAPVHGRENIDWEHRFIDREDELIEEFIPQPFIFLEELD